MREKLIITLGQQAKAMVFPLIMYRCESWTIKKAEHQRTDAFILRESFPRQVDRKSRGPQGERGLQMEEIACKCQTFLSLLSGRRKQTSNIFFLLYTNLKGGFS